MFGPEDPLQLNAAQLDQQPDPPAATQESDADVVVRRLQLLAGFLQDQGVPIAHRKPTDARQGFAQPRGQRHPQGLVHRIICGRCVIRDRD
jgi:hypothetical protein